MLKHPADPAKKAAIAIIALIALLLGIVAYVATQPKGDSGRQLTAEQVVDLEVEAERQFLEAGGEY